MELSVYEIIFYKIKLYAYKIIKNDNINIIQLVCACAVALDGLYVVVVTCSVTGTGDAVDISVVPIEVAIDVWLTAIGDSVVELTVVNVVSVVVVCGSGSRFSNVHVLIPSAYFSNHARLSLIFA